MSGLTEAQEITPDIPEERVTYDQEGADPQNKSSHPVRDFLRKCASRGLLALSEGEIAALTTAIRQLVVDSQGAAEALAGAQHRSVCMRLG